MCELLDRVRRSLDEGYSAMPEVARHREFAEFYITKQLGEEWAARNLKCAAGNRAPAYSQPGSPRSLECHERHVRTAELAGRLFELGQEPFYGRLVIGLLGCDLEGAAFMADVVRLLLDRPFQVNLHERQDAGGAHCDINLWLGVADVWWTAVASCADATKYTARVLTKALESARGHPSCAEVSMILLKVPTPWLRSSAYQREYADIIGSFLRSAARVHGVVLVWDHWTPESPEEGFQKFRKTRVFRGQSRNSRASYLLGLYEQLWISPRG